MNPRGARHERAYRTLLRLYPAEFRARFSEEMVQLFDDQLREARRGSTSGGVAKTWLRTLADLAVTAASERTRRDRTVAHSLSVPPSPASRILGLLGIIGGVLLVAAFLDFIPLGPDLFNLRLVLFNLGAIAIAIAVFRREASAAPAWALLTSVPVALANAWYLVLIVRIVAEPGPPGPGDYALTFDVAAATMWLTDAWFGIVTLRLGVMSRWGPIALAVGSVFAFSGMDRLGLVSPENSPIFGMLALAGVALNGIGWILLGLEVATRRSAPEARPHEAAPRH